MRTQAHELSLAEFLREEIGRVKKSTRRTWVIGIPVLFFLMGYMTWMSYKMKTLVFVPKHLAIYIAQGVDAEAPRIIEDTERKVITAAPAVARAFGYEVHKMIDELDAVGTKQVDVFKSMLPVVDQVSQRAINDYFARHGEEARVLYEQGGAEEFADKMVEALFVSIGEDLKGRVNVQHNGELSEGPAQVSIAFLNYIHERLAALAQKSSSRMTESERLERRLIVAWANAVGGHFNLQFHK